MGKAYLKFLGFVFGLNIFHPRWIIMSLVASFTLTSLAFKCGDALFFISVIPEDFRGISPFEYSKLVAYTHEPLLSYLFNWIMDSLTLGATAYLIAILIEEEQSSVRLGIILWDISIALTLSFFCYSTLARKDNSAARVQALAPYQGLAYGKENILTNVFSRRFSADQTVTKTVLHLMDETRASIKQEEAYRTESLMALQWASTNGTYTLIPVNKQLESDSRFSTRADAAYKLYRNSPDFFKTAPVESWQATLANARSNIIALNTSYSQF